MLIRKEKERERGGREREREEIIVVLHSYNTSTWEADQEDQVL